MIQLFFKGMLMGIADVVPGISGGTIALLLGIYEKLITEISHINLSLLFRFKFKDFFSKIDIRFLFILFLGILTSVALFSKIIHYLLENFEAELMASFLGLVLASVVILFLRYKLFTKKTLSLFVFSSILTYFFFESIELIFPKSYAFILLSGFIASSAMILPGISGSYLLVMMGMYKYIVTSLKNFFSNPSLEVFITIALFCLGVGIGVLSMSKVLKKVFSWQPRLILSVLLGLVIGGSNKIWPWKSTTGELLTPNFFIAKDQCLLAIVFMFFIIIMTADLVAKRKKNY